MARKRSNSATLVVGDTGTGKSALIATYAKWVYEKFGKVTLLYAADGGGWPTTVEALIEKGIIWAFKLRSRGDAFGTCAKASEGFWPREWDPETGEVSKSVEMIQPVVTKYTLFCPKGHELRSGTSSKLFVSAVQCKECKSAFNLKTGVIKEESTMSEGFENVGARAYDGLTSMQAWIMADMANRMANGEIIGEKDALGGKIESDGRSFGGNNRAHYGFAQGQASSWILNSTAIPGLVAPPIWTALEERATDAHTRLPIYGPKIAGSAKTSEVPSWVGNCLGTTIRNTEEGKRWRLYLTEYLDPQNNVPHLCKTRAAPGTMPDYLEDGPDEAPFTTFNLGYFFDQLDNSFQKTMEDMKDIGPGLPSGKLGPSISTTPKSGPKPAQTAKPNVVRASSKR